MSDESLTPLQRAVIRNHALRRTRLWALFRSLAGGVDVPVEERGALAGVLHDVEGLLDDAVRLSFSLPEELMYMPDEVGRYFSGVVEVCETIAGQGNAEVRAFVADVSRVTAALPENPAERLFLIDRRNETVAEFVAGRSWDGKTELRLRVVRRRADTGEWTDLLDEEPVD